MTATLTGPPATTGADTSTSWDEPTCRVCGCTDGAACLGGCRRVPDPARKGTLCSACRDTAADVLGLGDVDEVHDQLTGLADSAGTTLAVPPTALSTADGRTAAVLAAAAALLVSRGRHRGDWTEHPDGTGPCCLTAALRVAAGGDPDDEPDPCTPAGQRYRDAVLTLADRVLPASEAALGDLQLQESRLVAWNDDQDDDRVLAELADAVTDLARFAGGT